MRILIFLLIAISSLTIKAQVKITDSGASFKIKLNGQNAIYLPKNSYELYLGTSTRYNNTDTTTAQTTKLGMRNIYSGAVLISPLSFTYYRVNDTAYSTLDSVILKLRLSIYK